MAWHGHGWSSGCVSGLRLHRGASLSGRLLGGYGGCSGSGSPVLGSFAKGYSMVKIASLFRLGSSIGGGGKPSFWNRPFWMPEWRPCGG